MSQVLATNHITCYPEEASGTIEQLRAWISAHCSPARPSWVTESEPVKVSQALATVYIIDHTKEACGAPELLSTWISITLLLFCLNQCGQRQGTQQR